MTLFYRLVNYDSECSETCPSDDPRLESGSSGFLIFKGIKRTTVIDKDEEKEKLVKEKRRGGKRRERRNQRRLRGERKGKEGK